MMTNPRRAAALVCLAFYLHGFNVSAQSTGNGAPIATSSGAPATSVRFDSTADELWRTTTLPPVSGFTMMGWFRIAVDTNSYAAFLRLGYPSNSNAYSLLTNADGTTLAVWNGAGIKLGSPLAVGSWNHLAVTVSGTGSGHVKAYLNGTLNITFNGNPAVVASRLSIGNYGQKQSLNGSAAAVKIYDAVLSAAEIAQEMSSAAPVRTADLNAWYPLQSAVDAPADYSGNGRTLSVAGTLADDASGPPILSPSTLTTAEDTVLGGWLEASDPDGDPLTYSIVSNGARGAAAIVDAATGEYTYTPQPNATGSDSFTFKVSDGALESAAATVVVMIAPVNDAPSAHDGVLTVNAGASATGTLAASDIDNTSLTYGVVTNGTKGIASITNAATGAYSYTANAGASGADTFTFAASDGSLTSNAATVTVTITSVTVAPPVATDGTLSASEDAPATGTLPASDPAGLPLTFSLVSQGSKGTVSITDASAGAYTYTPARDANGTDSFTFRSSNGTQLSNVATITVTIDAVNDAPVALPLGSGSTAVHFAGSTAMLSRRTELPPAGGFTMMGWFRIGVDRNRYSSFVRLGHATTSNGYNLLTNANGTTLALWNGAGIKLGAPLTVGTWYHLAATVSGTATGQFRAYVNGVLNITFNGNASVTADRLTIGNDAHGEWLNGSAAAIKVYDAVLTAAEIAAEMNSATPVRTADLNSWYPLLNAADAVNDYSGNGRELAANQVLATDPEGPPVPSAAAITTAIGTPVSGELQGSDVDDDLLTFSLSVAPLHGTAVVNPDGTFTYAPAAGFVGTDSFTFAVSDGVASTTAVVTIAVVE